MRIVFMGSPFFAAQILDCLCMTENVVGVFSAPDAVRGRGSKLAPTPVKEVALQRGLPVFAATSFKDPEIFAQLESLAPDVICVAAFGVLLPESVLALPRYGCLNVHASLLPRWRGAAPIERAILAGDSLAGVSIMRMEAGLDTGDYCNQVSLVLLDQNADELTAALAETGAQALLDVLHAMEASQIPWIAQDECLVTYAAKIERHELDLSLGDTVESASRKTRASSEAHPCKVLVNGKGLTLERALPAYENSLPETQMGKVLLHQKKLYLGCIDGWLQLGMVKPDGKSRMEAAQYANGLSGLKQGNVLWSSVGEE